MQNILLSSLYLLDFEADDLPYVENVERHFYEFYDKLVDFDFQTDETVEMITDGSFTLSIDLTGDSRGLTMVVALYQIWGRVIEQQNDCVFVGINVSSSVPFYCERWDSLELTSTGGTGRGFEIISMINEGERFEALGSLAPKEDDGRLGTVETKKILVSEDLKTIIYSLLLNRQYNGTITVVDGVPTECNVIKEMQRDGWRFNFSNISKDA